ncbi:MAG TPA: CitMHS family transporter [Steroidobacteraceae bacterium]|nr:CitMHS family transporter [Steroidobacteraceae bacterium]
MLNLTLLGFGMVTTFMTLIMTRRLSPLVALISIPVLFALLGGFGGTQLGEMMLAGLRTLAPTGVMLMFAILYFGLMIDVGLFDPLISAILRVVGNDPLKVVVGTAVLATLVSLDGDGSTTYMITIAAMLPLYRRLRLDPLGLTCVTILANGVLNLTPWGGPLARVASALHVEPAEVFVPMLPAMVAGIAGVFGLAWLLGRREKQRLGHLSLSAAATEDVSVADSALIPLPSSADSVCRPKLLVFNALLTLALLAALVAGVLPLPVLFMVAFAIALVINFPNVAEQRERIAAHAKNVIAVVSLIFAAGIFTGILGGTGMLDAMAKSMLAIVPASLGPYLAPITALASLPFTFFVSNDAFYFGVIPIVAETANGFGIAPVEIARASLIGQPVHFLSPLVPSTYLLVGLAGVEFGDHQRYTLKWAVLICLLMLLAAILCAVFPFAA